MDPRFLPPLPTLPPGTYKATLIEADLIFDHKTLTDKLLVEFDINGVSYFDTTSPDNADHFIPGRTGVLNKRK